MSTERTPDTVVLTYTTTVYVVVDLIHGTYKIEQKQPELLDVEVAALYAEGEYVSEYMHGSEVNGDVEHEAADLALIAQAENIVRRPS